MSLIKRAACSLLRIIAGVPIVSLVTTGALLLVLAATLKGRSVGLSVTLTGVVLFCSIGYWNRPWFRRIRRTFCVCLLSLSAMLYLVPAVRSPSGGTGNGPVRNCYVGQYARFSRLAPSNVIPEVDQLKVGMTLLPLRDPHARSEMKRLGALVRPLYAAIERDVDFRDLGSAMGLAYRELFHVPFRTGHYFALVPDAANGERLPCLVFLHGMGGNMKPYLWVLSGLGKRVKCVVIAPTFGIGNWDRPGGAELVVKVVREAVTTLPVDPERIFLLGYSNGAMGVTRAAIQEPELFRGLIYLSPVTEDNLFSLPEFLSRSKDRRIVFLHGGRDARIPKEFVKGTVANLQQLGCDVDLRVYEDEDHFLLFSQPDAVLGDIVECMTSSSPRPL